MVLKQFFNYYQIKRALQDVLHLHICYLYMLFLNVYITSTTINICYHYEL